MIPAKELIGRLQNACVHLVGDRSECHYKEWGDRCPMCQAAHVIEQSLFASKGVYELADVKAERDSLSLKLEAALEAVRWFESRTHFVSAGGGPLYQNNRSELAWDLAPPHIADLVRQLTTEPPK